MKDFTNKLAPHGLTPLPREDKYIYSHEPYDVTANCGHIWKVRYHLIEQQPPSCPICNPKHKTEARLFRFVRSLDPTAQRQHRLDCPLDIGGKGYLFIDIFCPSKNLFVEYHGKQHYHHSKFFHNGRRTLEQQKRRDQWVRDYCAELGINYLELNYEQTQQEMEDLLTMWLLG